jgi:gamma-glutamyltranspeptidase/glutathione hydrolase
MVASASTTAAAVGLSTLARGGNAIDAALAMAGVEWFTLPGACGLGGDLFALVYEANSGRVTGINSSGESARAASRDYYVGKGLTTMPLDGWDAAGVPGTPAGYWALHQRFGTLPLADLWHPALAYARDGVVVTDRIGGSIAAAASKLGKFPDTARIYLPGGRAPRPGERWANPDLAATIETYLAGGPEAYYRGPIAQEIVRAARAGGGLFGPDEFADHQAEVYEPFCVRYRGVDVHATRPPSQGLVTLEILGLLNGFDLASMGFGSTDSLHAMVEAKKLAFADRLRYCGDPRVIDQAPVQQLLDAGYHRRRRADIDMARAAEKVIGAVPEKLRGDTSYLCAADGHGNAVSLIHSLSAGFGCGVVAGRTGVILNNRAGRGFTLEAGHPNVFAGGKKTMHTLNCYLLTRGGRLFGVGGTPGGDQQPQWNAQTISNVVDFGMEPQNAIEAPRWHSFPSTDPEHVGKPFEVKLESRFGEAASDGLRRRGHRVDVQGPWAGGGAVQLILRDDDGTLRGGSDPRAGGVALGF